MSIARLMQMARAGTGGGGVSIQYLGNVAELNPSFGLYTFPTSGITQASNCLLVCAYQSESDDGCTDFNDGTTTYSTAINIAFGSGYLNTSAIFYREITSMPANLYAECNRDGNRAVVGFYAITGHTSSAPESTGSDTEGSGVTSLSTSLTTTVGAAVVAGLEQGGQYSVTWGSDLTEDYDTNTAEGSSTFSAASGIASSTSTTASVTLSGSDDDSVLVAASWT